MSEALEERSRVDAISEEVARVLDVLPQAWLVTDEHGSVFRSSPKVDAFGVAVLNQVEERQLLELITEAHMTQCAIGAEISVAKTRTHSEFTARVRISPISEHYVLVLIEDITDERRLDEIRRDFVANISHELKTPVGALSILAEAIATASDDPETVKHFSAKMHREASRLAELVGDLIDLSRLQDDKPVQLISEVSVDEIVTDALDAVQMHAKAKNIEIVVGGTGNLVLNGNKEQLTSAIRNLLTNAIHYSGENTRVALGTQLVDGFVEMLNVFAV